MAVTAPSRMRLPHRRPAVAEEILWGRAGQEARPYLVTVGVDPRDGRPRELFLAGGRPDSELAQLLADVAVIVSLALQHGVPPAALRGSLSRDPYDAAKAGSVLGPALDRVVALEGEGGL